MPDSSINHSGIADGLLDKNNIGNVSSILMNKNDLPEYPGGMEAIAGFLKANIKYPENAMNNHIQGKVFVSFIVEKDGSLSNIKIIEGIGGGCDEEALRVVKMMKGWRPGVRLGQPVRVLMNLPVNFILKKK